MTIKRLNTLGLPSEVDLSSSSQDYPLAVGEIARISYTGATSVPLRIATVNPGVYEVDLINLYATPTSSGTNFLRPNNADTAANAVETIRQYFGSQNTAGGVINTTNFTIGSGLTLQSKFTISTRTGSKTMICNSFSNETSANKFARFDFSRWTDTTTPWSSLGTVLFSEAQTGMIVVRRVG